MADPSAPDVPVIEHEDEATSARNARVGMVLFVLYLALYGGFMGLNVYDPQTMSKPFIAGVNLAICYGLGLIVAALLLAAIYMYLVSGKAEVHK